MAYSRITQTLLILFFSKFTVQQLTTSTVRNVQSTNNVVNQTGKLSNISREILSSTSSHAFTDNFTTKTIEVEVAKMHYISEKLGSIKLVLTCNVEKRSGGGKINFTERVRLKQHSDTTLRLPKNSTYIFCDKFSPYSESKLQFCANFVNDTVNMTNTIFYIPYSLLANCFDFFKTKLTDPSNALLISSVIAGSNSNKSAIAKWTRQNPEIKTQLALLIPTAEEASRISSNLFELVQEDKGSCKRTVCSFK